MEKYGKLIGGNTLVFERVLPGPIDRVWKYIVDSEKRGKWFASGQLEPYPGGKMDLIFSNSQLSNAPDPTPEKYKEFGDGFVSQATVLAIDPPKKLSIDWENGIITFELQEQEGDEVKLTLTHEKLHEDRDQRLGAMAGWHVHLEILEDQLNARNSTGFWTNHLAMEREYDRRLS